MTILVEKEGEFDLSFNEEDLIKKVVQSSLIYENCPYEVELNVVLTNNEEIRLLNMEFRGIDKETDVLSFPAIDFDSPSNFSLVEENPMNYFNPENDELILGDIVVSLEKVIEQAEIYGHRKERELAFLIVHSMLHLLGYDHIDDDDRMVMEKKQEEILEYLGIVRG